MDKVMAIHKLRVNIKSLTAEAKIIRKEASRAGLGYKEQLHLHRVGRLREESRITHLALAYIRERDYNTIESTKKSVNVSKLVDKINRTGYRTNENQIKSWLLGAKQ